MAIRMKWTARIRRWNSQDAWRAILKAGVVGGVCSGVLFALGYFFPSAISAFATQPKFAPSILLLSMFALFIGALFGSATGLGASIGGLILRQIVILVSRQRVWQSVAVAVGAAIGSMPGSALLIAPFLPGLFGPHIWSPVFTVLVIAVLAGLVLGALMFLNTNNLIVSHDPESPSPIAG
jgi:MFS family permease